ncbi:MAG TPA: efflux RND transporter periplasmic adaptor subunit [Cyanobacteria bacterium UBA11149]|nr:efflux RND transporter periplasmic adaptor subunit [Cyanobacteria bacterium UBA11367]HBE60578.1 efflux RND transporter periplasmic adaptor subunit [Cyanobacteria bacterium UBA11366]HBK64960.1 efflux RND transporter periplasmic adaptor subunit [Cyanobacteria bacterium UBA11166]HBR72916.1 efflux RND transporter periplasmic adaptor subunit [Cyanobacteria bacterium UBA11159]HBS69027.1 efflux RND transporter periplasmic adaptor subunit [Cyanobacteria bacterium UBA11153]HBW89568.1 efflux RND tran
MKSKTYHSPVLGQLPQISLALLTVIFLTNPTLVLAHAGHGNEFKHEESAPPSAGIKVDGETVRRLGIKVEKVTRQRLEIGIKTIGKIEILPNRKVEVTAPIPGKVVELLVKPGSFVKVGEPLAVLSAPELVELQVNSQEKQAEATADLQKAQANLKLAKENRDRILKIADAEIAEAQTQLAAAKAQYERDKALVDGEGVLKVARENYQRQIAIAAAEIAQANTELAVAQEQYNKDKELAEEGAIPKRQMLESQAHLQEAKAQLARAENRPEVLAAETEIRRAEVDLPLRELRESEGNVAAAQAQLTKALSRREVLAAEAEVKRAQSDVDLGKSRLKLSNTNYQTRLQQLGTKADAKGLVTVTAPISGTVADREVTLGESFQDAGGKLMTIQNDSRVYATANIYEKDLGKIEKGQRVNVRVANLPKQIFRGEITFISSVVEGETRIVPVKAELDNSEGVLKPGTFAELEVLTNRTPTAILAIPNEAVVEANGKKIVYIQNGNAFQPVEVTLGRSTGDLVEVKTGLFENDIIVTQRAPQLYAESLRKGNGKDKSEDKHTESVKPQSQIPNWLIITGGGIAMPAACFAIATVGTIAFWAGRRSRPRLVTVGNGENNGFVYEREVYIDNHHESSLVQKAEVVEEVDKF